MSDGETTTYQGSNEIQLDGDQTRKFTVIAAQNVSPEEQRAQWNPPKPSPSGPLQRFAERKSVQDAQRIEDYIGNGQFIVFDSKRLLRRIRDFAEQDISNEFLRDDSAPGYEVLLEEYKQAYQRKLQEMIQPLVDKITFLRDDREKKLREVLSEDRVQVKTRSPGDWHARDLVLLRIFQIYYWDQLAKVDINELLKHHALIDRYEKFVLDFESRNEVVWPEDSFRS